MQYFNSYTEAWNYVKSDYIRYGYKYSLLDILFKVLICKNHCFVFSFWLRLAKVKGVFQPFFRFMHWRLSRKYGLQIPIQATIGYGLYIGHGIGVIMSYDVEIGNNINLSQFTTIGGHGMAPKIGDNVYIGPSVCIVNDVIIGNNVSIGAGSIVIKNIENDATVAGVPAKVLNFENPGRFVNNRYLVK